MAPVLNLFVPLTFIIENRVGILIKPPKRWKNKDQNPKKGVKNHLFLKKPMFFEKKAIVYFAGIKNIYTFAAQK